MLAVSQAKNMGVMCCTIMGVSHLRAPSQWPPQLNAQAPWNAHGHEAHW